MLAATFFGWLGFIPGFITGAVEDALDRKLRLAPSQQWRATQIAGWAGDLD